MAQVHYLSEARNDGSDLWRWSLAGKTLKRLRNGPVSAEDIAEPVLSHDGSTHAAAAGLVATFAGTSGDMHLLLGVLNELEAVGLAVSDGF